MAPVMLLSIVPSPQFTGFTANPAPSQPAREQTEGGKLVRAFLTDARPETVNSETVLTWRALNIWPVAA